VLSKWRTPFLLSRAGVQVEQIARIGALLQLPPIFMLLWTPIVDVKLRRRTWLSIPQTEVAMMRRDNWVSKSPAPKRKKLTRNPKRDAIGSVDSPKRNTQGSTDSQAVNKSPTPSENSDPANQALPRLAKEVRGIDDKALQQRLVAQATGAVTDFQNKVQESMDYVSAAMRGIGPQEGVEDLLAAEIVGMHTLAMEFMLRAAWRHRWCEE
jgi:hypothetical protein